ncbi:unnamed protein product [Caenorhabditis angaria]|uniref:ubiquitinyl hydrolase 1 n=1 Tax=Caenorhabditis angaria TaxID=860376 RepID=A0A9P1IEL2_9PELO|nr:unnamed protein product [Caenorhabditis angaria]
MENMLVLENYEFWYGKRFCCQGLLISNGKKEMKKSEDGGRLSSSCSSIRSSNYSRNYTPSSLTTSTLKYSPANYTPPSRSSASQESSYSTSSYSSPSYSSATLGRSSRYGSTTNLDTSKYSTLGRTSSSRYSTPSSTVSSYSTPAAAPRNLYSSPAAARVSISNNENLGGATSAPYRGISRSRLDTVGSTVTPQRTTVAVEVQPTTRTNMVHPTSSHIRSRSTSSYRTINVSQFTQQARERAEKEEKDRQYKEWIDREKDREAEKEYQIPSYSISTPQKVLPPLTSSSNLSNGDRKYGGYSSSYSTSTGLKSTGGLGGAGLAPPPPPPPPNIPRSVSAAVISTKPMAKISPYDDEYEKSCVVNSGFTGLRNIGNTCFMNSILQMLVNNLELREFFLEGHYKSEINADNPLGSQGRLASAFADFMRQMWSGMNKAIEPARIKEIVAEKASQFANFAQHDAHEFLSFLLDGLHEDVNRVKKKPITSTVESDGRHDLDVANEAWHNHLLRNDSIFVDLFHGQLKSHVQCPKCDRVSITFDPFVYLPVPFPKRKKTSQVLFWPLDMLQKPKSLTVSYSSEGTVADLLSAISGETKVASRNLRALEVFGHRIDKIYTVDQKASDIGMADVVYVFEVHDEVECGEEVLQFYVLQRQLYPANLRYMCNECGNTQGKLKACDACYNAYYCSKECQLANWSSGGHRDECRRRPTSEVVGQPLIVSFPRSQLTHANLYRTLEAKSRHTVTIFQQPQGAAEGGPAEVEAIGAPPQLFRVTIRDERVRDNGSSKKQTVFPSEGSSQKMFEIRKLTMGPGEAFGEPIPASGEPLNLPNNSYLTINWINQRFGKEYISVGNVPDRELLGTSGVSRNDPGSLTGNPRLAEMLDLFSETERLKPEESWYCSKCKEHVEATKRLQLYRLPPVLIIQLKRFVYTAFTHQSSMHRRSKDERTVEYPLENLDMSPFLADTAPKQASTTYDLTGVVCHSGSSYFGHYISMGRLADFESSKTKIDWRQFDDSMVSRQSTANIQTDDAYLLFYKLRDPNMTRSIFKKHYSCDPGEVDNDY